MVLGYKETVAAKIVETAIELLATKGYNNLTLDEIAEKLKISKGALYSYFKSKDDIIREIYKSSSTTIQKIINEASRGHDFKQIMETIFELTSGKYKNHTCIYFETYALSWHEEILKAIMKMEYEKDFEATHKFIECLVNKKCARADVDPQVLAHLFRAVWMETSERLGLGFEKSRVHDYWMISTTSVLTGGKMV